MDCWQLLRFHTLSEILCFFTFIGDWNIGQDGVFKMSLSPDGTRLAAIHFSGKLTVWGIPSLKQLGEWEQNDQVGLCDLLLLD